MKFDLHRLQLLRELAYRGTLTAVADAMACSASAVSQQLAILEQEIGMRLLEPDGRRVRLTPQAEILIRHTESVLAQLDLAEAQIAESMDAVAGTLRLATIQTAALALVPEMLSTLFRDHPQLQVHVTQAEPEVALPALLARDFDLVCDDEYPEFPTIRAHAVHAEVVAHEPIRLAFAKASDGRTPHETKLIHFADRAWVMEPKGSPGRTWTETVCRRAGFEPKVIHQTNDVLVQAQLVARGHAVAFLPDLMWYDQIPRFHLRQVAQTHLRRIMTTCRAGSETKPGILAVRRAFRTAYQRIEVRLVSRRSNRGSGDSAPTPSGSEKAGRSSAASSSRSARGARSKTSRGGR